MRSRIILFVLIFHFSPMAALVSAPVQGDNLEVKLNRRSTKYELKTRSFVEALLKVSEDFEIPMGISWVSKQSASATLQLAWKEATVREILKTIVNTQPGYQIEVRNGVAEIISPGLVRDEENFLAKKIKMFQVQDTYMELASFKLHNLITPPAHAGLSLGADVAPKISLELKNATVEDILDALALVSQRKIWIVTFCDTNGLTPSGLRRTKSLFTESPIPDEDQPVWYFHRWRDPIPPLLVSN